MKHSMQLSLVVAGACLAGSSGCARETKESATGGEKSAVESTTEAAPKPKPVASAALQASHSAKRSWRPRQPLRPGDGGWRSAMRWSTAPARSQLTTSGAANASDRAAADVQRASHLSSSAAAPAERVAAEPKPAS
jgi:hypothetical protein